ncbi:MAG: AraC family transcriptional regulator [Spirochaetia bacterium]|nr:AraC family transcriptional regulator [Spirochaetia bacterium]
MEDIGVGMEFIPPSEDMAAHISVFNFTIWQKKDLPLPAKSGPKIALCISNTEKFQSIQDSIKKTVPQIAVVGPVTVPYQVCAGIENLEVIFCEFTEIGFYRLFSQPASSLINGYISLLDVSIHFSQMQKENTSKLLADLREARDNNAKRNIIENYLRMVKKLRLPAKKTEANLEILQKAISLIKESKSQIKIQNICQKLEINERTLERWFQKVTGITIKQFINISRFTLLFEVFMQKEGKELLQEVYYLGYSDQAHAIREFKKYSGFSPGKIVLDKFEFANKLSDPFCKTIRSSPSSFS